MLSLFKSSCTMMFRYCNQLSGCYLAVCTPSLSVDINSQLLTLVTSFHLWIWPISVWLDNLLWDKIDNSLWDEEILISERICMTVTNTPVCVFGSILCKQAYTVVWVLVSYSSSLVHRESSTSSFKFTGLRLRKLLLRKSTPTRCTLNYDISDLLPVVPALHCQ